MNFKEIIPVLNAQYLQSMPYDEFKQFLKTKFKKEEDRRKEYNKIKKFCNVVIQNNGEIIQTYKYSNTTDEALGGRLYSSCGVQGLPKAFRGFFMKHTTDIDMKNAHPTILLYLCHKYKIACPHLEYYVNHREEILREFDDRDIAKNDFLCALNYNKPNYKIKNKHFREFDNELKLIQKVFIQMEEFSNLVNFVPVDKKHNIEGSVLNRIMDAYENKILQVAINYIQSHGIEIACLMFDGMMVYGDYYNNKELLNELESVVNAEFEGLKLSWDYKTHNDDIQMPDGFMPTEQLVAGSDDEASVIVLEKLRGSLKVYHDNNINRIFYKNNHIWIEDKETIDCYISNLIMKMNILKPSKDKLVAYSANITNAKHIREALYNGLISTDDPDFIMDYQKIHLTTRGRLCFLDGILDFINRRFYTWDEIDFEYYSVIQIRRNYWEYFNNPNHEIIDSIKDKIFDNMYGDKIETALHFFSRGIAGHNEDKNWCEYIGNRDCGKSIQYDAMSCAFEGYVKSFNLDNILCSQLAQTDTNDINRKLYWLMDFEFVRLGISQETPAMNSGLKIKSSIQKKITGGGDTITARRNYDRKDAHFTIDTTFGFFGNYSLSFDSNDCCEHKVEFCSVNQFKTQAEIDALQRIKTEKINQLIEDGQFYESELEKKSFDLEMKRYKLKDITLKDKIKDIAWRDALVYLFYENYKPFPVDVRVVDIDEKEQVNYIDIIKEKYEITYNDDDAETCKNLHSVFAGYDSKKITGELHSINIFKRKNKKGTLRDKICYVGIKPKIFVKQPDEYN